MSCVLVVFSDGQNLIPLPLMCVSHVTVTLLERSMGARHVPRYTPTHRDTVCIHSLASLPGTALMIRGINSTRCWKESSEILLFDDPVIPDPKGPPLD